MRKKALFVLTEDWFFLSHFQPMARAVSSAGFEVVVAARQGEAAARIAELGYRFVPIDIGRAGLSPIGVARSVLAMRKIISTEQPDVVHAIALPPVVVVALAAMGSSRKVILAPTGLGFLWLEQNASTVAARTAVRWLIAMAGRKKSVHMLFENPDDPKVFDFDVGDRDKVSLVGGAGVSGSEFTPTPLPATLPMRVAIVARMTAPKGITPVVEAVLELRATGRDIHLDLYGAPDPSNRRSIPESQLREWDGLDGITWHGHTEDVRSVWAKTHVAVLLSWREGLPRGLVEAMACGRPIVTTDVPGCRSLVDNNVEGFLVAVDSVEQTMVALAALHDDPELRLRMGNAARAKFEAGYTEEAVEAVTERIYRRLSGYSED